MFILKMCWCSMLGAIHERKKNWTKNRQKWIRNIGNRMCWFESATFIYLIPDFIICTKHRISHEYMKHAYALIFSHFLVYSNVFFVFLFSFNVNIAQKQPLANDDRFRSVFFFFFFFFCIGSYVLFSWDEIYKTESHIFVNVQMKFTLLLRNVRTE